MYKFLLVFCLFGAAAFLYKNFNQFYLYDTVIARVSLKTNCQLDPKAFAVKNINSGEIREFHHGEAFIKASLSDKLMVVLSEKYNQVSFQGEIVSVKQSLEIFQDCHQPIGIAGIFKSFNDQFSIGSIRLIM